MATRKQLPPFYVDDDLRDQLRELGPTVTMPRATLLFQRGDAPNGLYLLTSGKVRLSAGASTLRRICQAGCLLGLPATVRNRPYSLTAECIDECECIRISHDAFTRYLREHPAFCLRVVELLASELGNLRSRFAEEAESASRRLAPIRRGAAAASRSVSTS
jgi:CRP-like cAMP-binding protein